MPSPLPSCQPPCLLCSGASPSLSPSLLWLGAGEEGKVAATSMLSGAPCPRLPPGAPATNVWAGAGAPSCPVSLPPAPGQLRSRRLCLHFPRQGNGDSAWKEFSCCLPSLQLNPSPAAQRAPQRLVRSPSWAAISSSLPALLLLLLLPAAARATRWWDVSGVGRVGVGRVVGWGRAARGSARCCRAPGSPGCAGPCLCSSLALWWPAARAQPHVMMSRSGTSGNSSVLAILSCVPPELQPRGSARRRGPWRLLRLGESGCCSGCSLVPAPCRAGQGERDGPSSLPWPPPRRAAALSPAAWGQPWLGWGRGGRARGETSGETSLLLPGAGLRRREAELAPSPLALGGCWGLARPRLGFGTDEFPGSPELSRGLLVGARPPLRPPCGGFTQVGS
ncbi:hypothetical protein LUU34_00354400 [Aix galericulata]|nr:hypothetical protein LUU34_00354400 [Aix galericulata]